MTAPAVSPPVPWTVVSHAADDSTAATAVPHLMAWLADQPGVSLHTVLWARGPNGLAPYDYGRLADVGRAHEVRSAQLLRAIGLGRLGGGLAARAVRATLRDVPTTGVLYLSTAHAGAVLRYLPPGTRTVITHVYDTDRLAEPPLGAERLQALAAATHVWLATDEATRSWVAETLGLDPESIQLVPAPADLAGWEEQVVRQRDQHRRREEERERQRARALAELSRSEVVDPTRLRLGVRGSTWFRRDHTPRLVQTLLRRRPDLDIELVWTEATPPSELGPLLHDLAQLGVRDRLEIPTSPSEAQVLLAGVDVLVLATPDDHLAGSLLGEAARLWIPVVCFDTHGWARGEAQGTRWVVPYLDLDAMAEAVLAYQEAARSSGGEHSRTGRPTDDSPADGRPDDEDLAEDRIAARREELRRRDVAVVGPRILDLVEAGTP